MKTLSSLFAFIICVLFSANVIASDAVTVRYSEPLNIVASDRIVSNNTQKPSPVETRDFAFDAFGKRFDIALTSNRALLSREQRAAVSNSIGIYRGTVSGVDGSWARIVMVDDVPRGMLWDGADMYAIETNKAGDKAIIFRLADLEIAPGALSCGHIGSANSGDDLLKAVLREVSITAASGPGATSQIDLAVIADFEFTSDRGATVEADIIARMNVVDGLFSEQVGVQLNVNRIDTFPADNDPFTGQTDSGDLLDELADYRNATSAQFSNGLSHLFTARNLDGTTIGIAYGGALCSRRFGAGLTQGTNGLTTDSLVAAHEIGHNFGAPHDGTSGSACSNTAQDFLMAPRINGSDQFSACSVSQMQPEIASANCISALPSTDAAVVASGQSSTLLLGSSQDVVFSVDNLGTNSVSNVVASITVPAAVSLNSISAASGSCSSGAGTASCAIGSIAVGAGVSVTMNVTSIATGSADFVASITATTDDNSSNNQRTLSFTVDPAVDLLSTAPSTPQIGLNQATTIRPAIENRATIAATNVRVTITPGTGLQIDSVSWTPGTCSVSENVATCQAASLAAQSTTTIDLQITGTTEGSRNYTVAVAADETDIDSANNSVSGQVTVSAAAPPSGDDGGSGSTGWTMLLLLAIAGVWRRATRYHRESQAITANARLETA